MAISAAGGTSSDVVVVGLGVVGLVAAWRAARSGRTVTVLDPAAGTGATHAAAGMLAPVSETEFGEDDVLAINLASARAWPTFAADLEQASHRDVAFARTGSLQVAFDADDARELDRVVALQRSHGLDVTMLDAAGARRAEPLLGPRVAAAAHSPSDHQVDPRRVVEALLAALAAEGVTVLRRGLRRLTVEAAGRVAGLLDDDGHEHRAGTVVVAAGTATPALLTDLPDVVAPIRPVKGQILRLDATDLPWLAGERIVRGIVQGRRIYVVGRADGEVVVGATTEERSDAVVTAGGVFALLRDARALVPGIDEAPLVEQTARLRPATPDHLPLLGPTARDGLVLAAGHHRHGILQLAATSEAFDDLWAGREPAGHWRPADPSRFTTTRPATVQESA
ncbi:glycine oxidase ThiO [Aeromicrobium halocynthiae]|uniref:glycine oxidase n=1 Tax=Aeromicrobium halocynthiae TaxID=560557 RepID=A0ABN2VVM6_9ACTN